MPKQSKQSSLTIIQNASLSLLLLFAGNVRANLGEFEETNGYRVPANGQITSANIAGDAKFYLNNTPPTYTGVVPLSLLPTNTGDGIHGADVTRYNAGAWGTANGGPGGAPADIRDNNGLWKVLAGGRLHEDLNAPNYSGQRDSIIASQSQARNGTQSLELLANDTSLSYEYKLDSRDFDGLAPAAISNAEVSLVFWVRPSGQDDAFSGNVFRMGFVDAAGRRAFEFGYTGDNRVEFRIGQFPDWYLTASVLGTGGWSKVTVNLDLTLNQASLIVEAWSDVDNALLPEAELLPASNVGHDIAALEKLTWQLEGGNLGPGVNNGEHYFDDFDFTITQATSIPTVGVGNLVYLDLNNNARYDYGEGRAGVTVQLFFASDPPTAPPFQQLATDETGCFQFSTLPPGDYYAYVPPLNFEPGAPLFRSTSLPGSGGDDGNDDDVDENGVDDPSPEFNGIRTDVFTLSAGTEPSSDGTESGKSNDMDDFGISSEYDTDLTIDFGFKNCLETNGGFEDDSLANFDTTFQGAPAQVLTDGPGQLPGWNVENLSGGSGQAHYINGTGGTADPAEGTKFVFLTGVNNYIRIDDPGSTNGQGDFKIPVPGDRYKFCIKAAAFTPGDSPQRKTDWRIEWVWYDENGGNPIPYSRTTQVLRASPSNGWNDLNWQEVCLNLQAPSPNAPRPLDGQTPNPEWNHLRVYISCADPLSGIALDNVCLKPTTEPTMGAGNLVFLDANDNGHADSLEGVDGTTVQLFRENDNPNLVLPLVQTFTRNQGCYQFLGIDPGNYFVRIAPSEFSTGGTLANTKSLTVDGGDTGVDDGTDENGINAINPAVQGVQTSVISLMENDEPFSGVTENGFSNTKDDEFEANVDLTVDLGFSDRVLGIGNFIFNDTNENGHAEPSEGVNAVLVELFQAGDDPATATPVATTTTSFGLYNFTNLPPGDYFVHIPKSEFAPGKPLYGKISLTGSATSGDDNLGEKGVDATAPSALGISSAVVMLRAETAPVGLLQEGGQANDSDDAADSNSDLTIDFGFKQGVGVGNLVYLDANGNSRFDSGEGTNGVVLNLYAGTMTIGIDAPVLTTTTAGGGFYLFNGIVPGDYFIHVPGSEFQTGKPLATKVSIPGAGEDTGLDDERDENGEDAINLAVNGVRSGTFNLAIDLEPVNSATELGQGNTNDNFDDNNVDLTVDFGFRAAYTRMGVGNALWVDRNNDCNYDNDEGINNVTIGLYNAGENPLLLPPLQQTTTFDDGCFYFFNVPPGTYFLHVAKNNFLPGGLLAGLKSCPGAGADDGKDDQLDENGLDAANPTVTGVLSINFTLTPGTEPKTFGPGATEIGSSPTDDQANEFNVDLTIDLGFTSPKPPGYQTWVTQNGLPASTPANPGDQDNDGIVNPMEFAFCTNPLSGANGPCPLEVRVQGDGSINVCIRRIVGSPITTYTVQGIADLGSSPSGWQNLALGSPILSQNADGSETACYEGVDSISPVNGQAGFVRVKVEVDTGSGLFTGYTDVGGWNKRTFQTQHETFSLPFAKCPTFSGSIDSASSGSGTYLLNVATSAGAVSVASLLSGGKTYYVDILTGALAGHRFTVDRTATTASSIALDSASPYNSQPLPGVALGSLTNSKIAVVEMSTLADLFPESEFFAGDPLVGDLLLTFGSSGYTTYYLADLGAGLRMWMRVSGPIGNQGGTCIAPGTGAYFQRRAAPITRSYSGFVRSAPFAQSFNLGYTLAGNPYPQTVSPSQRGFSVANGFTGSTDPSQADQLLFWLGDSMAGEEGYSSYFLLDAGVPYQFWIGLSDPGLNNQNNAGLFPPTRAAFISTSSVPATGIVMPPPWTP